MVRFLILITISFSLSLNGQELVRKKKTGSFEKETFFLDKVDKKKNGPYLLQNLATSDTLVSGHYRGDSVSGIWSYYSKGNQLYMKYDYDSRELTYASEKIAETDSFYILENGKFVHDKVDSPPLFIGYEDEIRTALARSIKPPGYIMEKGQSSTSVFSIEIGSESEITKYVNEQGSHKGIDEQVLQILKNFNGKWIPAKKTGEPVVSKIFVIVRILPQQIASQEIKEILKERPYIWKVDITYFGVTRVTKSVTTSGFTTPGGFRSR